MAFTTSYQLDTDYDTFDYARNGGEQKGGTIIAADNTRSLVLWYDVASASIQGRSISRGSYAIDTPTIATGVQIPTAGSGQAMPVSAAKLANGNIVVTWASNAATSDIYYTIVDKFLNVVVGPTLAETATISGIKPDVAATSTGFVIAWEKAYNTQDHDIAFRRFDLSGASSDAPGGLAADASNSTFDRAPSVAVLSDDSIVIGWDRLATNGSTAVYQTIIDATGTQRLAPTLVDNAANPSDTIGIHRDVEVLAQGSGYTLFYESSLNYGVNDTDIAAKFFSGNGALVQTTGPITPVGNNGDVAAARAPGGNYTIVVATTPVNGGGTDIVASVIAPDGSTLLGNVTVAAGVETDRVGSVTFLSDALAWIGWDRAPSGSDDGNYYAKLLKFSRVVTGDAGDDTIVFNQDTISTTVNAGDGRNIVATGGSDDRLTGGAGNDVLIGGAGNDVLTGGGGSNELYGGTGNDAYVVASNNDTIVEYANEGTDAVYTSTPVYVLPNNVEQLFFSGTGTFVGVGNGIDNVITGGIGRDELYGRDGNDTLRDGGGDTGQEDTLFGGLGDDIYVVTLKGDSTKENANEGNDTVQTKLSVYVLQANVENLTFTDNLQHDAGVGNELANTIRGGTGADAIYARDGDDIIYGGTGAANTLLGQGGNDTYYVQASGDSVVEYANEGTDTVRASIATFVLPANVENLAYVGSGTFTGIGNALNNQLNGGAGVDTLSGQDGDDVIFGGGGADFLQGGAGKDAFAYVGGETGYDRITDFAAADDRVILFSGAFTHTATLAFVSGAGAAANSTNSTFLYDTNTGIVSYDADGNGAGAAVQLAQLNLGLTLSVANFGFF